MPVAKQNVGPASVVEIEETASPAQKLSVRAQPRGKSCVLKISAALIVIKRRRIARKISFDNVEIAIEIVIGGGSSHAGFGVFLGAEGAVGALSRHSVIV